MMTNSLPSRGEIWLANLNPGKGHEQKGTRPCLVISVDLFNHGPAELLIVVPLTTKNKSIPLHVKIEKGIGKLDKTSYAKSEDIRSISKTRLIKKIGSVKEKTLNEVLEKIKILLDL